MENLKNQVALYSIDTNYFMFEKEKDLFEEKMFLHLIKKGKSSKEKIEKYKTDYSEITEKYFQLQILKKIRKTFKYIEANKKENQLHNEYLKNEIEIENVLKELKDLPKDKIKKLKELLDKEFEINTNKQRCLTQELKIRDRILMFESNLSRTLNLKINDVPTDDIFIIRVLHYPVFESICKNGFTYNNKYVMFTASAGMIRNKKVIFIKENLIKNDDETLTDIGNTIFCGLDREKINEIRKEFIDGKEEDVQGMVLNKYLAYTSLVATASQPLKGFDIDRSIVVDDFTTFVNELVENITYPDKNNNELWQTERKPMSIELQTFDGAGICTDFTGQIRLPYIKGLMIEFPIREFIQMKRKEEKEKYGNYFTNIGKVKDIYNETYDVLEDDIKYIFTKSQFKMWKHYKDWAEYKQAFKKFHCEACICSEDEENTDDSRISYQPLQTLYDLSDEELLELLKETNETIKNIANDKNKILEVIGATKENNNKNYYQKALMLYPQLLNDSFTKQNIKDIKASIVNYARQGKFKISGSKYAFILPDTVAFAEWLFCHNDNAEGLLKKGEVSCNQFTDKEELSLSRSPHLNFSHCLNTNVINDDTNKWFKANGIYVSRFSTDSEIMKNDYDGDEALIFNHPTIIKAVKRIMAKHNFVPLHYQMEKGSIAEVNEENLYNAMIESYKGGKIGQCSNSITKIWNCGNIGEDELKAINFLAVDANVEVDYAKTLWKPEKSTKMNKFLTQYTNPKVPYFFIYIKDKKKTKDKVEEINNSVVNRLVRLVCNDRIIYGAKNLGKFSYKNLLSDKNKKIDITTEKAQEIISKFIELNQNKKANLKDDVEDKYTYANKYIKDEMKKVWKNEVYIVNILVEHFFNQTDTPNKKTLWNVYGKMMYENISKNINQNVKICENCGEEIIKTNNRIKYCTECAEEINREKARKRKEKIAV